MGQWFSRNTKNGGSSRSSAMATDGRPSVRIVNQTLNTVVLRDRERDVYGITRYEVPPLKEQEAFVDLSEMSTFYRMAVCVKSSPSSQPLVTTPCLHITTEDLYRCNVITITCDRENRYQVQKTPRNPDSF